MDNNQYENIDSEVNDTEAADTDSENNTDAEVNDAGSGDAAVGAEGEICQEEEMLSPAQKIFSALYDYIEIFAVSIIAVIFIFSFCVRLCRVDGDSMNQTLRNDERILVSDTFYTPHQGDIIVFHLSNDSYHEPLVKRVIATEGQTIELNFTTGELKVDGVRYNDEHAFVEGGKYDIRYDYNKDHIVSEDGMVYFRATVPEGKIFVMGDNRNGSSDSRSERVGFVDLDCVLGKAIVRLKPFTLLGE